MTARLFRLLPLLLATFAAAGCGRGDKAVENQPPAASAQQEQPRRERVSVLTFEQELVADPAIADVRIFLPQPYRNARWPQYGGAPDHAPHHLTLPERLTQAWRTKVGRGSAGAARLISAPIVAEDRVYTIDVEARVSAVDAASGAVVWQTPLRVKGEPKTLGFGGGLAYAEGRIFATTGFGTAVALDAGTGEERWRYGGLVPFRGGPTVAAGRLFAITQDNQVLALDTGTGQVIWTAAGIPEDASLLGAATPAVTGDTVVAALSSGELMAMRVENARTAWQDTLSRTRRLTPLATLADIDGNPVIDGGRVYAVSHAGRMVAIDMRSGERVWEINVAGVSMPWIAGDYLFVMTADSQLVAIAAADGRIRWVTQLQRFGDPKGRSDPIFWAGPVLAGDRLVVASSHGYALSVSPYTGEFLSGMKLPAGTLAQPVVADNSLYILTEKAELVAYR